jgi:hypothetical protein
MSVMLEDYFLALIVLFQVFLNSRIFVYLRFSVGLIWSDNVLGTSMVPNLLEFKKTGRCQT